MTEDNAEIVKQVLAQWHADGETSDLFGPSTPLDRQSSLIGYLAEAMDIVGKLGVVHGMREAVALSEANSHETDEEQRKIITAEADRLEKELEE